MTREDIIRMAKQVGITTGGLFVRGTVSELKEFADLITAAERERCAEIARQMDQNGLSNYGAVIAARILG